MEVTLASLYTLHTSSLFYETHNKLPDNKFDDYGGNLLIWTDGIVPQLWCIGEISWFLIKKRVVWRLISVRGVIEPSFWK